MELFEKIGALIEQRWRAKNFDDASFAKVALGALQEMPPSEYVNYSQIVQWVMSASRLPPQNLAVKFGEPPLTLYYHDLFYIEALFWLDVHSDIHQHGFSGAFHLLDGSSLHCRYEFDLKERVNARFLIGDLHLKSVEFLMKGDSRPIQAGRRFIHATFHLDRPTITIVVRTPTDGEAQPQYSYLKPFLAHDPFTKRELTTRQLELLNVLHEVGHPDYLRYVNTLVSQPDFEATFFILEESHRHLSCADFVNLLDRARERHGHHAELVLPVLQEMRRIERSCGRCQFITKPEHRFLLGALLHLPDRESTFNFIRWHFDSDPVERIINWIEEMASIKIEDSKEPNALGIRFDESSLLVFKCLLQGLSFAAIKERLKQEYDPGDVEAQQHELQELCAAFQNSGLFKPLFVSNTSGSTVEITGRKRPGRTRRQPTRSGRCGTC
jgi:hypothetical protein